MLCHVKDEEEEGGEEGAGSEGWLEAVDPNSPLPHPPSILLLVFFLDWNLLLIRLQSECMQWVRLEAEAEQKAMVDIGGRKGRGKQEG